MTEVATAYVILIPNAKGFGPALNRQVGPQVKSSGAAAGAGFGKSMLKSFLAIGAGVKIAQFFGDSLAEAHEAQKVGAATAQIIKQTGSAANVTTKQVERLTAAMSKKIGVDDETIQSAANIVLTFKQVRNEGAGVEAIFNRATRAAADLSSLPGMGGIEGAAKMLGKALANPERGLTALTRAGVVYTDQQVDQIKAMVDSNNILGAQKIILAEVESEFGGLAEAQATASDKAGVALANLKEQIGTALLPAVNALANLFTFKVAPAISSFVTNLQSGKGAAGSFGNFISNVVVPALTQYYTWIFTKVVPAIRDGLVPWITRGKKAFNDIRNAIRENKPQLTQLFNAFKRIVDFWVTKMIPASLKLASVVIPALTVAIKILIATAAFWVNVFNRVRSAVEKVIAITARLVSAVRTAASKVIAAIKGLPSQFATIGRQMMDGLINAVKAAAGRVAAAAVSVVKGAIAAAKGALKIGSPSKVMHEVGENAMRGLEDGIAARTDKVAKKAKEAADKIREALAGLRSEFAGLVDPISSAFTGDLFSAETASEFVANLTGTKGTLKNLAAAFKTLIKQGLNPKFLYGLFQSGNAGLILDLAANPVLAAQAGGLFGDVTQLSNELGQTVAGATPEGKAVLGKMDRLEHKLNQILHATNKVGSDVGREVNGAASNGRRRAA